MCKDSVCLCVHTGPEYFHRWIPHLFGKGAWAGNSAFPPKGVGLELRVYKMCENSKGYVWNVTVYTGRDTVYRERSHGE